MTQLDLLNQPRLLSDARADIEASLEDGVTCPCCGQFAKQYRRKLNAPMARYLIAVVRAYEEISDGWVEVPRLPIWRQVTQRGDYTYLRHWGFLVRRPNDDTAKRTSGFWRPTDEGDQFARGKTTAPRHVLLYNGEVRGWSREQTTIRQALGDGFDYAELMGWL